MEKMEKSRVVEIALLLEGWRCRRTGTEAYMMELQVAAAELDIPDSEMFEFFKEVFTNSLSMQWDSVSKEVDARVRNASVEELELSVRAYNCLKNANLKTVGEILDKTDEELLRIKNFGRKPLLEVREAIAHLTKV